MLNLRSADLALDPNADADAMTLGQLFFDYEGRIGRLKFFLAYQGGLVALVAAVFAAAALLPESLALAAIGILFIVGAISGFSLTTKRWHDMGYSGWMQLIGLVPYVGGLVCWVLLCFGPGTKDANAYGAPPA